MFETTTVESRVQPRSATRVAMLPVSLGAHALAVSSFFLISVWSVAFPLNSPPQISGLVLAAPLPKMVIREPEPVEPEPAEADVPPKAEAAAPPAGPLVDAPPASIPENIPDLSDSELSGPLPKDVTWNFDGKKTGPEETTSVVDRDAVYGETHEGVVTARVLRRVNPVYPPLLDKVGMSGSAVVECIVGRDGSIISVTVVSETSQLFGESAREAVMKWKFLPGRLHGTNVATVFQLTVNFNARR